MEAKMNTIVLNNIKNLEVSSYSFYNALMIWVDATTDPTSDQREDLLHDKTKAVNDFFNWICKLVDEITPNDVKTWQFKLERRNLTQGTIYSRTTP
jgi:hypothetical protein